MRLKKITADVYEFNTEYNCLQSSFEHYGFCILEKYKNIDLGPFSLLSLNIKNSPNVQYYKLRTLSILGGGTSQASFYIELNYQNLFSLTSDTEKREMCFEIILKTIEKISLDQNISKPKSFDFQKSFNYFQQEKFRYLTKAKFNVFRNCKYQIVFERNINSRSRSIFRYLKKEESNWKEWEVDSISCDVLPHTFWPTISWINRDEVQFNFWQRTIHFNLLSMETKYEKKELDPLENVKRW